MRERIGVVQQHFAHAAGLDQLQDDWETARQKRQAAQFRREQESPRDYTNQYW